MPPDTAFRASTYLALALACASLGYAESALLPEVAAFALLVVAALAIIFRIETRVPLLALADSNKLGAWIAVFWVLWAGFRVLHEFKSADRESLSWPLFAVALMAPVLMAAIAAKMLRREKHAGDYWQLHAAGLCAVVLAGAMSDEPLTFVLTGAYAVCAVWTLALFFRERTSGAVPAIPGRDAEADAGPIRPLAHGAAPHRTAIARAFLWTTFAAAAALPLYLLTPRSHLQKLDFGQARVEIGYAADQMIDLNRAGDLHENTETAFEVAVTDDRGQPKDDLSREQRWRGSVLITYSNGSWRRERDVPTPTAPLVRTTLPWSPPNLGAGRIRIAFTVPAKLRSTFLADPVEWTPGDSSPVADVLSNGRFQPWYPIRTGPYFAPTGIVEPSTADLRYVQYVRPPDEPDLSPAFTAILDVDRRLLNNPVARVKDYADRLVERLVASGELPPGVLGRDAVRLLPAVEYHEAMARAFRAHLAEHAGLLYTTRLRRENKGIDPVEEFLFESKAGHCERFAAALTLMLRSQGIPAVMVLGFKGCESIGEGRYLIGQEHAHAWVEALIPRRAKVEPGQGPRYVRHWLSLDATPSQASAALAAEKNDGVFSWGRTAFRRYLIRYSPAQRARAVQAIGDAFTGPWLPVGLGTAVLTAVVARLLRRRAGRPVAPPRAATTAWFGRMLDLLAAHGYAPEPGETAREFAAATAASLRHRTEAVARLAEVPVEWADAYYRSRFGGVPLDDEQLNDLEDGLEALRRALNGNGTSPARKPHIPHPCV